MDNTEGQLTPEPAELLGCPAGKGGNGCHVLCTEQLQAEPPAEAYRVFHPGTAAGEEAPLHHPVRMGQHGVVTPDFAQLLRCGRT